MHYTFQFESAVKVQGNPATTLVFFIFFSSFFKLQYYSRRAVEDSLALCSLAVRVASDSSDCDWPGLKEIAA